MPTITEMIPNIDSWPEWAQEAAERGQLVSECMTRIATLELVVVHAKIVANAYSVKDSAEWIALDKALATEAPQ